MKSPALVAIARDPAEAAIWVDALRQEGIEAASFERGPGAALGGVVGGALSRCHVLVDPDRIEDARNVVAEMGGAAALAPVAAETAIANGGTGAARALLLALLVAVAIAVVLALMRLTAG